MGPISKLFRLGILLGFAAALIFTIKYFYDTSYEGDETVHFLQGEYPELESVLQAEPFQDKIVYVDMWFSTCGFCRRQFGHLPRVKDYLKDRPDVVFLYLSHETRHPNSTQLWKNAIQEFELDGWHYMMDRSVEKSIWQEIREKDTTVRQGFPHYMIIDNTSGYRDYNAPKPSEFETLKATIDPLLKS
jgi:thiol-disulfide isomerase/thioredoxin